VDSIRVWLEPGYDQGRTGAWLLDWPGAFTYGATRQVAMARVTSAAHRFVDWLVAHGEQAAPVPAVSPQVQDEDPAVTRPDGYVVNAIFAPDRRPVGADEIEAHLRRLAFARADLEMVVDRIHELESSGASLADGGRSLDEVLGHVAGAETWFVSRLEPGARYDGPRDPVKGYLAASRSFLADGLRRLASEGATERVDGKGETWTLAKIVRRSLYHSLDHLEELDRRLAASERRIDRIELRRNAQLTDPGQLRRLFATAGLLRRSRDSDETLAQTLAGSTLHLTAWDGDDLVGFARLISDESSNAYVSTVAIAPRWQDRGLGTRLMRELMLGREHMKFVLEAAEGAEQFYERLGFHRAPNAFVRPRGVS
jgi:N-acetylglutamate synthase-like GNAT family acetyltransferase